MLDNNSSLHNRGRGRPPITDVYCSEQQICDCYNRTKSMRKTALELGIAVRTVFKYVNNANASFHVGGKLKEDSLKAVQEREIALDIGKLGVNIPKNISKIADALNHKYSKETIRYYLKSRAKAAEETLRENGNLLDYPDIHLRDIYGRIIPVGYFGMYQLSVDIYTLNVTIEATLNFGGKVICRMSFKALQDLLEGKKGHKCPPN